MSPDAGLSLRTGAAPSGSARADVAPADDKTAAIRSDIERTRAEMGQTIDALQERLSPAALKEQAQDKLESVKEHAKATVREATVGRVEHMAHDVSDTARDAGHTMLDTIKQNPIPAALAAIGIGWLVMKGRETASQRHPGSRDREDPRIRYERSPGGLYDKAIARRSEPEDDGGIGEKIHEARETASEAASQLKERVGSAAEHAKGRAGAIAHQAQDRAGELARRAQSQADRAENRFEQTMEENPLALGAVALALGAAAGLAIPRTRKEDEVLGQARDQLVDKAQGLAHQTLEKVQHVAEKATDEAKQTAKEEAKAQGLSH